MKPLASRMPFIATALLAWAGNYWPIAVYVAAMALITVVAVYLAPETFRSDITEERPEERQLIAEKQ